MSEKKHHDLLKCLGDRIDVLEIERDDFRARAEKAEVRVKELLADLDNRAAEARELRVERDHCRDGCRKFESGQLVLSEHIEARRKLATEEARADEAETRVKALEAERDEVRLKLGAHQRQSIQYCNRAESAETELAELLAEREQQARELKRLQDENAEWREELQHERNRSAALELERKNTPTAGVADRIVTSPEFRRFLVDLDRLCGHSVDVESLLALLDAEVKR